MIRFGTKVVGFEVHTTRGGKETFRLRLSSVWPVDYIDFSPKKYKRSIVEGLVGHYIVAGLEMTPRRNGPDYPKVYFVEYNQELKNIMTFTPTPAQQLIIDEVKNNPSQSIVVDARAGAAKTSTIVLAAQNIGPQHTPLAVAFNKKIADELTDRLPSHFTCRTLNALGHRAWADRLGKRISVDADKNRNICKALMPQDTEEQREIFSAVLTLMRKAKAAGLVPRGAPMGVQGLWNDEGHSWEQLADDAGLFDVPDEAIFWARKCLIESINQAFKGVIDYDDQIYMSVLFGGRYGKYHTVIVDEAQDLSPLNHRQIAKLTGTRAIIVGDPFQAIYGFRGADSNSITNLVRVVGKEFKTMPLSLSFRCPKSVSARQRNHVPDYGSMDFLGEGTIEHWPKQPNVYGPDNERVNVEIPKSWSLHSIPQKGFVLCRNNAPLMALAFAMIKQRRPVKILGRDIGASIANLLLKVTGKNELPIGDCFAKVEAWKTFELQKAGDSESKIDLITDRYECLIVLLEASGKKTNIEAADFIRDLFSDTKNESVTTFSSGHRAKGLEEDWVMVLDPWRCPSKQAQRAEQHGNYAPMEQEKNLKYVMETRTKDVLVFANLADCLECGDERVG